jgi:hypothetical protein
MPGAQGIHPAVKTPSKSRRSGQREQSPLLSMLLFLAWHAANVFRAVINHKGRAAGRFDAEKHVNTSACASGVMAAGGLCHRPAQRPCRKPVCMAGTLVTNSANADLLPSLSCVTGDLHKHWRELILPSCATHSSGEAKGPVQSRRRSECTQACNGTET